MRGGIQLLGFVIGIGLLAWCASIALRAENREQLRKLADANAWDVLALAGLSALSLVINASVFWVIIRPVRRVPWSSVMAVNAVATALASLPFKLSVVCRFVVHNRRDGVPLLTITTWMGNVLTIMLATLAPIMLAGVWRGGIDAAWWGASIAGVVASCVAIVLLAKAFSRERVWIAVERWVGGPSGTGRGTVGKRVVQAGLVARAQEGVRMLSFPSAVGGGAALRCADLAIQATRFMVAARISGQVISGDDALLAASAYFLVGVFSPTGALGFREAAVFGLLQAESFSIIVLTVTAVDTVVLLVSAAIAAIWLRVGRVAKAQEVEKEEKGPGR